MAHFAKLNENNEVIHVSVVDNSVLIDRDGNENEQLGIDYLTKIHDHSNWKQTSYNGNFRKYYAGLGFRYYEDLDVFLPPKPFKSWLLDTTLKEWVAPEQKPDDGKSYYWDESSLSWIEFPENPGM